MTDADVKLVYRQMTESDIADAFTVRLSTDENRVTLEELRDEYGITPASLAQVMNSRTHGWVCSTESGELIGFAMGDSTSGEVVVIAVLPAYVGQGIGKRLLSLVRDRLFDDGHDSVWLRSNPDHGTRAYAFYRRLGWHPTGQVQGDDEILAFSKHTTGL